MASTASGGRFGCPVQLYSRGRFGCPVQLVGGGLVL